MNCRYSAVIMLLLSAVMYWSCSDDVDLKTNSDSNFIGFSVAHNQSWNVSGSGSRAFDPMSFIVDGLEDTIYMHLEVVDSIVPTAKAEKKAVSRATPVKPAGGDKQDSGNFADVHKSFGVSAYVGNVLYMGDLEVKSNSSGIWATTQTYFWPAEEVDFYAYAPYYVNGDSSNGKTFTASGNTINSSAGGEIEFTYTVPKGADGENKDAEVQPDLMFSGKTGCTRPSDGTQALNFAHAMAAVQFQVRNIPGCTINSISINNVHGSYTCVYDVEAGTFAVKEYHDEAVQSYVQSIGIAVDEENDGNITELTNRSGYETHTFMMLPQDLASTVKIEVNLTLEGATTPVTIEGSIGGADKSWEAGKTYIYTISNEVTNWTYVFDVTPSITIPFYGTKGEGTYSVVSYKTGLRAGQTIVEPVEWEVVSYNDGVTDRPDWLDEFTASGSGVGDVNSSESYYYAALAAPIASSTSHTNLIANESRGTAASPFNLSNPNNSASTEPYNTANCYIVNASGYYKLPLIYGNGYNQGAAHSVAYNPGAYTSGLGVASTMTATTSGAEDGDVVDASTQYTVTYQLNSLSSFKDHNDADITTPWIVSSNGRGGKYTPAKACVIWQDEPRLLTDVKLSETKDYIEFTVLSDYICEGNAVVAVKDADDNVMWSWHIWVSDTEIRDDYYLWNMPGWNYILNFNLVKNSYAEGSERTFYMMRDSYDATDNMAYAQGLGFCDAETKKYETRELTITFRQKENGNTVGDVKTMTVTQSGSASMTDNACYYQWGRKDPILPATSDGNKDWYVDDDDRTQKSTVETADGTVSLGYAIKNPDKFIVGEVSSTIEDDHLFVQNWCEKLYMNLWNAKNNYVPVVIYDYEKGPEVFLDYVINGTRMVKTVYDPCPVGYEVPRMDVWTGFSRTGSVVNGGLTGHEGLLEKANLKDWYVIDREVGTASGYSFYVEPNSLTSTGTGVAIFMEAFGHRREPDIEKYGVVTNAMTSSIICVEWQKNDGSGMNNYYKMEPTRLYTDQSIHSVRPISTSSFDLGFGVIPVRTGMNPGQQVDDDIEKIFE